MLLLAHLQISGIVPLPASRGWVGLFHYPCVISLAIFGVESELALSYGLVLPFFVYLLMKLKVRWERGYRVCGRARRSERSPPLISAYSYPLLAEKVNW